MKNLRFISGLALGSAIALLAACGQKGPLYLPAKPAPATTSANPTQTTLPTPAENKKPVE